MSSRWIAVLMATLLPPTAAGGENPWFEQGRAAVREARALQVGTQRARNVIVFLGDGMGVTTITAARILEGQFRGKSGEENQLAFEQLPHVSLTKTYNTNQQVPDSAGTMTAILAGAKTRAGIVGLDASVELGDAVAAGMGRLPSLVEQAEQRGLSTGVVTTARITHATPAAAYAHSPHRDWEQDTALPESARAIDFPDIARQLVEFGVGDGLDVVFGGGRQQFMPHDAVDPEYADTRGKRGDGRNLVDEWRKRHPDGVYVWDRKGFDAIDPARHARVFGLFQPGHMRFEADRGKDLGGEPSLAEMTEKSLEILSRNAKGFVLVVEGGRIDHAHHLGNAHRALVDTIAFSDAVRTAMQRTSREDTLIVVTADHGHVLTIGGYATRGNPILGKVVVNDGLSGAPKSEFERDLTGSPYTTLGYYNGRGAHVHAPRGDGDHDPPPPQLVGRDLSGADTTEPEFRQVAAVPLLSETHSGEDVPVYAGGPGSALFHGVQEQSYLYHAMVEALGWNDAPD